MSILQEIEDFLIVLRDNYGFQLPVDRLKLCLSSPKDITDVEEVLYRLQSLVCENDLQIQTFQSLFAQRFLDMCPKPGGGGAEPKKKKAGTDDPLPQEEKNRMESRADQLQRLIDEDTKKKQELLEEIKSISQQQRGLREASDRAEGDVSKLSEEKVNILKAAQSRPKSPNVRKDMDEIAQLLDKGIPSAIEREVRAALSSASAKKDLDPIIKRLLQLSSQARSSKNMTLFKKYLDLVAALKKYQSILEKSLLSPEEKQAVKALESQMAAKRRAMKEIAEQQDSLNDKSYWKNQEYNTISRRIPKFDSEREKIEERLRRERDRVERERQSQMIAKPSARNHREIFTEGINAVQTMDAQAQLMKTSLTSMSADQRNLILSYIRSNAKVFRQTLRRKSSTPRRHQVDVRRTMRAAARTDGDPINIKYKKPKKSHAKVIILTDISGSCRQASTLALYFMGLMDDAFPGGCRKYVFVNHLVSVDRYFRDRGASEGVEAVLNNVPSRGVYSNYGATIHELREDIGGIIHKDTTIIILGDARNNKNQSAANDLKYIADRCHQVFWLNTETQSKWDTGDSVIGQYISAGADVRVVMTAGDLIGFLSSLSVH